MKAGLEHRTAGRSGMAMRDTLRLLASLCLGLLVVAPVGMAEGSETSAVVPRDGQRDFDFEFGTWTTRLSRRLDPLTGSDAWVDYEGTSVVREVAGGRANLVELDVRGPAGRIEGLSLRLYDPGSRQWSLNFANLGNGALTPPTIGEFKDGRGEFYAQDTLRGRSILVRFVITPLSSTSCRFEQAFSSDGGKTWEVNWIATDTRIQP